MISILTKILFFLLTSSLYAQDFFPNTLFHLDNLFSHHVILVEKSTHSLFLYENVEGTPKLIKKITPASGKFKGDKDSEGDHKTPEGVYTLLDFLARDKLNSMYGGEQAKLYGVGAFTSDYPNLMDRRFKKGGSGIWLHSSDDESRIEKGLDSRGCVVIANNELKQISQYIELNKTPMIIVQDVNYLSKDSWLRNQTEVKSVIDDWIKNWKNKDFANYIKHYHPQEFQDGSRGNFNAFSSYKKAVFSRSDTPVIEFDGLTILGHEKYAVVFLRQNYKSPIINDIGKKTLYLMRDKNYEWKIVAEIWEKFQKNEIELTFTPSPRFFK